jgi:hypothetical protein
MLFLSVKQMDSDAGKGLSISQKLFLGWDWYKSMAWKGRRPVCLLFGASEWVKALILDTFLSNLKRSASFMSGQHIFFWKKHLFHKSKYALQINILSCRFFSVGCVYGRANDAERFGFFCHAALEFLLQNGFNPVRNIVWSSNC